MGLLTDRRKEASGQLRTGNPGAEGAYAARAVIDLTLRCPECGRRADMCFDHGDDWKKRQPRLWEDEPPQDQLRVSAQIGVGDDWPEDFL